MTNKNNENNVLATINASKFDFSSSVDLETVDKGRLGTVAVFKREWEDKDGNKHEIAIDDPKLVASAVRIEQLLNAREMSSYGICYELSVFGKSASSMGFKSIGEMGYKCFGIKTITATQYARVGKWFIDFCETPNGIKYAPKPEFIGASVTNLVQILSLVDENGIDPLGKIIDLIANGSIHLAGTLANLKKELKALEKGETIDENGDKAIDVKGTVVSETKEDIAQAFSTILSEIEKMDDTIKEKALDLVKELQEMFTTKFEETKD